MTSLFFANSTAEDKSRLDGNGNLMQPKVVRSELRCELQRLLPACLLCVLLPLPAVLFWHSVEGRSAALGCLFVGCTSLVAFSFRQDIRLSSDASTPDHQTDAQRVWRQKMLMLAFMLLSAFAVFSVLCLAFNNPPETEEQAIWWRSSYFNHPRDLIAPMLAFMTLIPSLCLVPFLTLATRSCFDAVILTIFMVFGMKLLGAIVVVLVYGWNAAEEGHTKMPWNHPDLLVWLFWGFTAVLSVSFYFLGARRFRLARSIQPSTGLNARR